MGDDVLAEIAGSLAPAADAFEASFDRPVDHLLRPGFSPQLGRYGRYAVTELAVSEQLCWWDPAATVDQAGFGSNRVHRCYVPCCARHDGSAADVVQLGRRVETGLVRQALWRAGISSGCMS